MLKKQLTFIFVAFFLTAATLNAQETGAAKKPSLAQLTFSEAVTGLPRYMFKDAKGAVYTIKNKDDNGQWLTKFDNTLKQVFEKQFIMPKSNYDLAILNIFLWNGKPTIFCSGMFSQAVGQVFYFTVEEDGTLSPLQKLGNFTPKEEYLTCGIAVSPDSSKLLLYAELSDEQNDLFSFKVFDVELKEIWHTKSTFDARKIKKKAVTKSRTVALRKQYLIDNKGRFFVTTPVARKDERATINEGDYYFEIHQFRQDTPKPKIYTIDFKGKTLYNFELCTTKNPDELLVFGTYTGYNIFSSSSGDGGVMGTFRLGIDVANGVVSNKIIQDFPNAFFDFMKVPKNEKAMGNGIKDIKLRASHLTENGHLMLLLEENYNQTKSFSSKEFYSDLAIFVKYDPDGKVLYQRYIPKKSNESSGSHILFLQKEAREILIFNDNVKNRTKEITTYLDVEESDWTASNTRTYALLNGNNGEYEASIFMPSEDNTFVLQPNAVSIQYGPQSVIALVVSRKDERKVKLVRIDY